MTRIELQREKRKLKKARKEGVKAGVKAVRNIVSKVKVGAAPKKRKSASKARGRAKEKKAGFIGPKRQGKKRAKKLTVDPMAGMNQ